jgi:hypothetical protein
VQHETAASVVKSGATGKKKAAAAAAAAVAVAENVDECPQRSPHRSRSFLSIGTF